jgi:hypothetical protein
MFKKIMRIKEIKISHLGPLTLDFAMGLKFKKSHDLNSLWFYFSLNVIFSRRFLPMHEFFLLDILLLLLLGIVFRQFLIIIRKILPYFFFLRNAELKNALALFVVLCCKEKDRIRNDFSLLLLCWMGLLRMAFSCCQTVQTVMLTLLSTNRDRLLAVAANQSETDAAEAHYERSLLTSGPGKKSRVTRQCPSDVKIPVQCSSKSRDQGSKLVSDQSSCRSRKSNSKKKIK